MSGYRYRKRSRPGSGNAQRQGGLERRGKALDQSKAKSMAIIVRGQHHVSVLAMAGLPRWHETDFLTFPSQFDDAGEPAEIPLRIALCWVEVKLIRLHSL